MRTLNQKDVAAVSGGDRWGGDGTGNPAEVPTSTATTVGTWAAAIGTLILYMIVATS